jgi:hypothetical protein
MRGQVVPFASRVGAVGERVTAAFRHLVSRSVGMFRLWDGDS